MSNVLNKEICIKCFDKAIRIALPFENFTFLTQFFVEDWNKTSCCYCPMAGEDARFTHFSFGRIDIRQNPPENCPYQMEQMVSNG